MSGFDEALNRWLPTTAARSQVKCRCIWPCYGNSIAPGPWAVEPPESAPALRAEGPAESACRCEMLLPSLPSLNPKPAAATRRQSHGWCQAPERSGRCPCPQPPTGRFSPDELPFGAYWEL